MVVSHYLYFQTNIEGNKLQSSEHFYLMCHPLHPVGSYLSLLVDDGHCVLQLDVVEQAGQENVCHADQTVVLLLIEERVGTFEIGPHHLGEDERGRKSVRLVNKSLVWLQGLPELHRLCANV